MARKISKNRGRILFVVGLTFMVLGISRDMTPFLAVGVVFFIIGAKAIREEKKESDREE